MWYSFCCTIYRGERTKALRLLMNQFKDFEPYNESLCREASALLTLDDFRYELCALYIHNSICFIFTYVILLVWWCVGSFQESWITCWLWRHRRRKEVGDGWYPTMHRVESGIPRKTAVSKLQCKLAASTHYVWGLR